MAVERLNEDGIFYCPDEQVARLIYQFTRTYGLARRFRQELAANPDCKEPIWMLWHDEYGQQVKNEKGQNIGTPVKLANLARSLNKCAWIRYQELEEAGFKQYALDSIEYYERAG